MTDRASLPPRRNALTVDEAHAIWDVLIAKAGASPLSDARRDFAAYMTDEVQHGHEYRFGGLLGCGGKLHHSDLAGAYVSCYLKDRDEVRAAIIAAVNAELKLISPPWADRVREWARP